MQPCEQAVRRYIDAWLEPDRGRRAQLLEACFAAGGRIAIGGRMVRGRSELAAMIEAFQADPQLLSARLTSPIDADGMTFRFRALFTRLSALSCYGPCLLKTIPPRFPGVA